MTQNTMAAIRFDKYFIPAIDATRRDISFTAIGEKSFMMPPESLKEQAQFLYRFPYRATKPRLAGLTDEIAYIRNAIYIKTRNVFVNTSLAIKYKSAIRTLT